MYNNSNEEAQLFAMCRPTTRDREREEIYKEEEAQNERGEVASPMKSQYYSYVENFPGPIPSG